MTFWFVMLSLECFYIIIPCSSLFSLCGLMAGRNFFKLILTNIPVIIIKKLVVWAFASEDEQQIHTCREIGWALATIWIQRKCYLPKPLRAVRTICNPSFFPCLQTVILHELIMVLRVNQAWGGGMEGGVEVLWKHIGLRWALGLSPPCGNTMHRRLTIPRVHSSLNSNLLLIASQLLVQTDLVV